MHNFFTLSTLFTECLLILEKTHKNGIDKLENSLYNEFRI
nr:MAG TPA: hypothetical protein [Caudoviricetes sp.]DAU45228.1 MAG TPA: hypothetical protein [Caudoviricetes sp.]